MSEGNASKEAIQASNKAEFTPKPEAIVSELILSARQAIEQKRLKQCMVLIKAILSKDPGNREALALRSWIRSYLEQDLAKIRGLIDEARSTGSRRLYARAEVTLRAILDVDPEHKEADELLSEVRSLQSPVPPYQVEPEPTAQEPLGGTAQSIRSTRLIVPAVMVVVGVVVGSVLWFIMPKSTSVEPPLGTLGTEAVKEAEAPVTNDTSNPETGTLAMVVLPLVGVQMAVNDGPSVPVPESVELKPGSYQLRFSAAGYLPETVSQTVVAGERRTVAVVLKAVAPAVTSTRSTTKASPPAAVPSTPQATKQVRTSTPAQAAPVKATTGTLTLNSLVPVQVYLADQYIGSTPVTITLPQGLHTLEVRYQDFRKMVSYVIKENDATTATISFDIMLRINAEPWAEVLLDGSPQKSLGHTPLSGVTLPAGSILIFKNPSFPEKKYQVDGKESSIHIAFP